MLVLFIIVVLVIAIAILLFLHTVKICEGGQLMQGCGRLLFPWSFKFKVNGKYCCKSCFERDYKLFTEKNPNIKGKFRGLEEDLYDGFYGEDSNIGK